MKHLMMMFLALGLAGCDLVGGDGPWCGNGVLERGEDCDGKQIAPVLPATCVEAGYHAGTPRCSACRLDFHPCVPSGRCGDGHRDAPYEECDGHEFGEVTCESLGHYAGLLECSRDCRIVTSACKRCGDGVVQTGFGEVVELSLEACMDAGFFGGVLTTADCRTAQTTYCGNYRLLTEGSSLLAPVVLQAAPGELRLAGVVQGTLAGFSNPGCPDLQDFYYFGPSPEDEDDWVRTFGGYYYPACRDHFFATLTATPGLQTHYQRGVEVNVIDLLDLDDDGFAFLRDPGTGAHLLELVDAHGEARFLQELEFYQGWSATPPVTRLSADELAIVTQPGPPLIRVRRLSLSQNRITATANLDAISHQSIDYLWGVGYSVFHTVWMPDGNPLFLLNLRRTVEEEPGTYLVRTTWQGDRLVVDAVVPLQQLMHHVSAVHLLPDGNTLEVVWYRYTPGGEGAFFLERWTLQGARTASFTLPLPQSHYVERVFRTSGGDWVLAGGAFLEQVADGMPVTCVPREGDEYFPHLMALRFSPDGDLVDSQYFYSPTIQYGSANTLIETVCQVSRRHYHATGDTLVVAGTWDRSGYFCTPDEPVTRIQLDPLHACGIWLVKLEFAP